MVARDRAIELPLDDSVTEPLEQRIALLASDRESGASEILDEVLGVFRDAIAAGVPLLPVARAVCRAQPSMASVWNAALEVVASDRPAERLDTFAAACRQSPSVAEPRRTRLFPGRCVQGRCAWSRFRSAAPS